MIRKINFKQPKYIFPLVVFIPLCALVYFVMQTFGGGEDAQQTVATDRINTQPGCCGSGTHPSAAGNGGTGEVVGRVQKTYQLLCLRE